MPRLRIALFCGLALCGFAANSLLARRALGAGLSGAASFTAVRLGSGAAVLWLLARGRPRAGAEAGWRSAFALFLYAAPFSWAYLRIGAGLGALLLFGAVQTTMFAAALGYPLWNTALPSLAASRAAVLQIITPALTAAAAVALLAEPLTPRLLAGGGAIVGGVAIAVLRRR